MSGDSELLENFDAVILGTGLCESVLAAAFSRIGHSVLHLDRNTYYGELESTHSLNSLLDYANLHSERLSAAETNPPIEEGSIRLDLPVDSVPSITNLVYETYDISNEERLRYEKIIQKERDSEKSVAGSSLELNNVLDEESNNGGKETAVSDASLAEVKEEVTNSPVDDVPHDSLPLNPVIKSCVELDCESSQSDEHKLSYLKQKSNKFILDLTPKLLFARSAMIDLLISSDVARYCEFRSITQILTLRDQKSLEVVPCSRSDIFSTKSLSMIEKRILMKVLTLCMEYENRRSEYEDFLERPFVEFLRSQKLTPNLLNYVLHAIAMVPPTATLLEGLQRTQLFLKSLGRYGPTPFLWPLYGGEINQAFCRMSAVFGGVYILHRTISSILINTDTSRVTHVVCNEGKEIKCKWLITGADYMKTLLAEDIAAPLISRAIIISSGSLSMNTDKEEALLLSLPSLDGASDPVSVIELGPASCVCPRDESNLRVVHLTTRAKATAQEDLQKYVDLLFSRHQGGGKPRLLLACYFNKPDYAGSMRLSQSHPSNLFITPGPDANINPDSSVLEAKIIFTELCPGEEFIPRPPNPEDIIYCDDESKKQSPGESFSEEVSANQSSADSHVISDNQSADSSTPSQSVDSSTPYQSGDGSTPGQSADSSTPSQSADSSTPNQSADSSTPNQSADSSTPNQSADSSTPSQSGDSSKPSQSVDSSTPYQSGDGSTPNQSADSSTPNQSADNSTADQ